jgi:hypothetical protein
MATTRMVSVGVTRPTARPLIARVDHCGGEVQEAEIQSCYPCLASQTWAVAGKGRRSALQIVGTRPGAGVDAAAAMIFDGAMTREPAASGLYHAPLP